MDDSESSDDEFFKPLESSAQGTQTPDTSRVRKEFADNLKLEPNDINGQRGKTVPLKDLPMSPACGTQASAAAKLSVTLSKRGNEATSKDDPCLTPRKLKRQTAGNNDKVDQASSKMKYSSVRSLDLIELEQQREMPPVHAVQLGEETVSFTDMQVKSLDINLPPNIFYSSKDKSPVQVRKWPKRSKDTDMKGKNGGPNEKTVELMNVCTTPAASSHASNPDKTLHSSASTKSLSRPGRIDPTFEDEGDLLSNCDEETLRLINAAVPAHTSTTMADVTDDAGGPEFYGLGRSVRTTLYEVFKISRLHPWQRDVLDKHLLEEDGASKNGLIVAPTSGGKTLVAVVIALHTLLVRRTDVIMVLPFIAIVQEKVIQLQRLGTRLCARDANSWFAVAEYAGNKGQFPLPVRKSGDTLGVTNTIYVCTIEKASVVWRHITREPPPFRVGCVIMDELQMMGEPGRGGIFEELVTGVLYWSGASTRIVALSATVGNAMQLATYLGGGKSAGCILHQIKLQPQQRDAREFVVVLGASFPIVRDDKGASAQFAAIENTCQASRGDGDASDRKAFDVIDTLDHVTLQGMHIPGDDDDQHRVWLRVHQHRQALQATGRVKLPHRPGYVKFNFPSIKLVPKKVSAYCTEILASGNDAMVRSRGVDPNFVRGVARLSSCGSPISVDPPPADPYAGRSADRLKMEDAASWDMRVTAIIAVDAVQRNRSLLIFCPTKASCASTCRSLTTVFRAMAARGDTSWPTPSKIVTEERRNIMGHLAQESDGTVHNDLLQAIEQGLAYHNAGLSLVERTAVEGAFSTRCISIICCTSTLASGVNLPCDSVLIRTPWVATTFVTCTRYLQMIGRAGRTGLSSHDDKESYILVAPEDVGRFQSLLECHVEEVRSQLLESPPYYQSTCVGAAPPPPTGTCLARLVVAVVGTARFIRLSALIHAYRSTLLYMLGAAANEPADGADEPSIARSIQPLLGEIKELVTNGHLQVLLQDGNLGHNSNTPTALLLGSEKDDDLGLQDRQPDYDGEMTKGHRYAVPEEIGTLLELLVKASIAAAPGTRRNSADVVSLPDVVIGVSTFATASDIATIALCDAAAFVKNVKKEQGTFSLQSTLPLLLMTVESHTCRKLTSNDDIRVTAEVADTIEEHDDAPVMKALGITFSSISNWLSNKRIRGNLEFNEKLSRLWACLFIKGVFENPEDFDKLCLRFNHDRSSGTELIQAMASRCIQLSNFCNALGDRTLWWYPSVAKTVARRIRDACAEEIRPLLAVRHVTRGRARLLYDAGFRDVAALATVYPPALLEATLPHLGLWRATDMVIHARDILRNEAVQHATQSKDRLGVLTRSAIMRRK